MPWLLSQRLEFAIHFIKHRQNDHSPASFTNILNQSQFSIFPFMFAPLLATFLITVLCTLSQVLCKYQPFLPVIEIYSNAPLCVNLYIACEWYRKEASAAGHFVQCIIYVWEFLILMNFCADGFEWYIVIYYHVNMSSWPGSSIPALSRFFGFINEVKTCILYLISLPFYLHGS